MDTASFFFSFESDSPPTGLTLASDGTPEVSQLDVETTLAGSVLIVQNEACLLCHDNPATTPARAEIGRISALYARERNWDDELMDQGTRLPVNAAYSYRWLQADTRSGIGST
jgi:hypothetical protein